MTNFRADQIETRTIISSSGTSGSLDIQAKTVDFTSAGAALVLTSSVSSSITSSLSERGAFWVSGSSPTRPYFKDSSGAQFDLTLTGVRDHTALTSLAWVDSGHTGETNGLALFDVSGSTTSSSDVSYSNSQEALVLPRYLKFSKDGSGVVFTGSDVDKIDVVGTGAGTLWLTNSSPTRPYFKDDTGALFDLTLTGARDHTVLTTLDWSSSGHTGVLNAIALFDVSGSASASSDVAYLAQSESLSVPKGLAFAKSGSYISMRGGNLSQIAVGEDNSGVWWVSGTTPSKPYFRDSSGALFDLTNTGSRDHTTLTNLTWSQSGHVGPSNGLAFFDPSTGAATASSDLGYFPSLESVLIPKGVVFAKTGSFVSIVGSDVSEISTPDSGTGTFWITGSSPTLPAFKDDAGNTTLLTASQITYREHFDWPDGTTQGGNSINYKIWWPGNIQFVELTAMMVVTNSVGDYALTLTRDSGSANMLQDASFNMNTLTQSVVQVVPLSTTSSNLLVNRNDLVTLTLSSSDVSFNGSGIYFGLRAME